MSDHLRKRDAMVHLAVEDVQIGATDAAVRYPDLHLLRRRARPARTRRCEFSRVLRKMLLSSNHLAYFLVTMKRSSSLPSFEICRTVNFSPLASTTVKELTTETNLCVNGCHVAGASCCSGL